MHPWLGALEETMTLGWTRLAPLLLGGLLLAAGTALAENPPQKGRSTTCADTNAVFLVDGPMVAARTGNLVDVEGGTGFEVASDGGTVIVDFFAHDGRYVGWNERQPNGTVPPDAAFGSICVSFIDHWPAVPNPTAAWRYQDGF